MTTVIFVQGGGPGAHAEDALLAESLRSHLGEGYTVEFPLMPDEGDPDPARWSPAIAAAIEHATAPLVLVGHSVGGYLLLRHLAENGSPLGVSSICVIAAPFPSGDTDWTFEGFDLPEGIADRLPTGATIHLYASEDDEIVPFAHRALWAEALPGAVERTTTGGHQLGGDLRVVAADILQTVS
jgi:uncharacterized protein